jgi:muramoyltetrapeptide carboxypeptidase
VILIDPPLVEAHGRVWSHLASDSSHEELHAFARRIGVPERGFDGDHYDVPSEWYDEVVAAGATPVSSRELVTRLTRAGLRRPKPRTLLPRPTGRALLRPSRLRTGDLVAVVSPAGPTRPDRLAAGVGVLESWGLRVRVEPTEETREPWLAGDDAHRAAAFSRAWGDPDVAAVWTARGGFGTQRMLDLVDWDALAGVAPKLLVGFSDITALHQAVAARWGLATVHGPGVAGLGDGDADAVAGVRALVMDGAPLTLRGRPGSAGGAAEGTVTGGNLAVLASGSGTSLVRPAAHGVALLEDVGEPPYRLDRWVTQLLRTGWFDDVRGVALGQLTGCGDPGEAEALLVDRLAPLGVPVVTDLPVGHVAGNRAVPLGVHARLDADAGTLAFARTLR